MQSLVYYNIQQGVLQQRLSKYYSFYSLQNILKVYNNFKNKLQEEKVEYNDPYTWLESDYPGRKMTDSQIIECTVD